MSSVSKPSPPTKPDYQDVYISPSSTVYKAGDCEKGTSIKVFIPDHPYRNQYGKRKVVIYLHGFALVPSQIYLSHIMHLVQQGFYVFYPHYQRGFCTIQQSFWQNICEMGKAVLHPYPIDAEGWMRSAINSFKDAYSYIIGLNSDAETYLFGHSLGGLQALSWFYYASDYISDELQPKQIIVADPIPTSDGNIPGPIRFFLNRFGSFKTKLTIQETGKALTVPVAILHGNADHIVRLSDWKKPFHDIKSHYKQFYYSQSDDHGRPIMKADHMQATVNTGFFPNWMAKSILGGVGVENNLNWRYIWYALDQVIREQSRADQLKFDMGQWSDGEPVRSIGEGFLDSSS